MAVRDVSILLTENDLAKLHLTANEVKQQIQSLSTLEHVKINASLMKPEVIRSTSCGKQQCVIVLLMKTVSDILIWGRFGKFRTF